MSWGGITGSLKKAGKQAWKVGTYSPVTNWLNKDPSIPNTDDAATRERQRIDGSVEQMNALYGIAPKGFDETGHDVNGGFNRNARAGAVNRKAIDANIKQQGEAAVGDGTAELDNRMDNWLTDSRRNLSDRGLIGGSVDASARTTAINGYLQGKSSLNEARTQAEKAARDSIERRRASGEGLIRTGGSPILSEAFNQQVADVHEANQQIPYAALGDLFKNQANVYSTQQQVQTQQTGNNTLQDSLNRTGTGSYTKG